MFISSLRLYFQYLLRFSFGIKIRISESDITMCNMWLFIHEGYLWENNFMFPSFWLFEHFH